MSKQKITIWGREFDIPAVLECYPGETVLDSQKAALKWLAENGETLDNSLTKVKAYVQKNAAELKESGVENIFKYVMPKSIFIPHNTKSTVAILCNYKFDMEHGLAVVFEKGKLASICPQDDIL